MLTRIPRIPLTALALTLTPGAFGQAAALSDVGLDRATEPGPAAPAVEDAVPDGLPAADWAGIRAAYEVGRHAAYPLECGYQARNLGQRWRTRFDGRGFTTQPDAGLPRSQRSP